MAFKIPPLLKQAYAGSKSAVKAAVAFSFVLNLLTLAMPLFTMQLYDRVLLSGSGATLGVICVAALAALGAGALLENIRSQLLISFGCRLDAQFSAPLFARLVETAVRTGGLVRGDALRDLDVLRQILTGGGALAVMDLPWAPLFIIGCAFLHPLLGLLALIGALSLIGLAMLNQQIVAEPLADSSRSAESSYGLTEAVMRNAEVVQAMGMLPAMLHDWRRLRLGMMYRQAIASTRNSNISGMIKFFRYALQIAIFSTGAWLTINQKISPGSLFAASLMTTRALTPIDQIVGVWRQLVTGQTAMARVEAAFAAPERPSAMPLPNPAGRLSVETLTYAPSTARPPILNNVSFALEPGESLGIVGASAAGKSTMARLIVGAIRPSSGVVRLDGGDVYAWDREAFGRAVGYLPQDVELFDGAIRDNICRFRACEPEQIVVAARLAGAHELILGLPNGYETVIGGSGASLSGGQRQRIGLARAVFGDPRLVVLDEPNSSLDGEGEAALAQLIVRLKTRGATVVMIAHRPSALAGLDKVMVLVNGGLAAIGPVGQILPLIAPGYRVPARPAEVRA
ncbi:MAG: type I secretion system permease/ATPase [Caulobacteraceae bacterium]|nr:type I secretion system permease/ATPase [Caulobacteraceae bacterium]